MKEISEFTFEAIKVKHNMPIIYAMKATRLLRQGCRGSLARVLDKKETKTRIKDIHVKKIPHVFPEELSSLP